MEHSRVVDLRSDTVTMPSPAMRKAMFEAGLGDDVMGEDPTVNRLQAMAAERLGKEAALFVPTGTMANLVSLLTHCNRGDEAIMGHVSHMFLLEGGGCAVVGGIQPRTVPNQPDGTMDIADLRAAMRDPANPHFPRSRLICLENTHNRCGGAVLKPTYTSQVRLLADEYGLAIHLDGARVFNAAIALGLPVADVVHDADSVSFCLSKGLSAPVGSLICGSEEFIQQALRQRKVLGGGMRQAGVVAAAGIVALETMVERIEEDHANAKKLAEGLSRIPGIMIDPARFESNLLIWGLSATAPTAAELKAILDTRGVKIHAMGERQVRTLTHYGIDAADVDYALNAIRSVLKAA